MLPFCGYNVGSYFQHWLDMQRKLTVPPKIFCVNWFRKNAAGKFLWPGYGENMRVLKWIVDRAHGSVGAQETLFGWVAKEGHIDLSGLDIEPEKVVEATSINEAEWKAELESEEEFFKQFGATLPKTLEFTRLQLLSRL
jgi:phosphoenolpyruvate carboxykinase (GTP)